MERKSANSDPKSRREKVVHDTGDVNKFPGIDTIEGRARPLLLGTTMYAQSVEMPSGLSVQEHPEPCESMVYTVRGRWVLSLGERKHQMGPGSVCWLDEGVMAGIEVPFDEPALVLNFARLSGAADVAPVPVISTNNLRIVIRNTS